MTPARYLAHRAYYVAAYRGGIAAVRLAVRLLPLHRAADLADRLAAAEARAADPDRYGVTYAYRRPRRYGTWEVPGAAVGVDRFDVATDAGAAARAELEARARRALARADRYIAVADGRRWWREVTR